MGKKFESAPAFKSALEARLRKRSQELGVPYNTVQLKFVIERLLSRLFRGENPPWILKGGFALDLRFRPKARTTKDVDLSITVDGGSSAPRLTVIREQLQAAGNMDLGDFLTFRIGMPKKEFTNAPAGGARFPCEAVLLGKRFASFHIDIGIGDALVGNPDTLSGDDILEFAAIEPATALAISKAQQFAEKLHAYTFPWSGRQNTRTKDLVDLVLLIERGRLKADEVRRAIEATFATRATHPVPSALPAPPANWADEFFGMAHEAGLQTTDYLAAFDRLLRYWTTERFGQ
jgi:hypothetical protein